MYVRERECVCVREREEGGARVCVHLKAITPGEAGTSLQHALLPLSEWHCLLWGFSGCQCIHRQRVRERVCVNESGGGSTGG